MATQVKTMQVKSDVALAETTTKLTDTVTFDVSRLPNGITYKGLKAVLSFADPIEWNKASTYDALTVVWDDATLASYASKRPVPSGIDITNELYWLRMADGDAQVEIYRQEVRAAKDDIDVLRAQAAYSFSTVAAMQAADYLRDGTVAVTEGYFSANDGGGATYFISSEGTANGMDVIKCGTKYATMVKEASVDIAKLGGVKGQDVTSILQYAIDTYSHVVLRGNYLVDGITIGSNVFIDGLGCTLTKTGNSRAMFTNKKEYVSNARVDGLRIDMNGAAAAAFSLETSSGVQNCIVEFGLFSNMNIFNYASTAIILNGADSQHPVQANTFSKIECASTYNTTALELSKSADQNHFYDCAFANHSSLSNDYLVKLNKCGTNQFNNFYVGASAVDKETLGIYVDESPLILSGGYFERLSKVITLVNSAGPVILNSCNLEYIDRVFLDTGSSYSTLAYVSNIRLAIPVGSSTPKITGYGRVTLFNTPDFDFEQFQQDSIISDGILKAASPLCVAGGAIKAVESVLNQFAFQATAETNIGGSGIVGTLTLNIGEKCLFTKIATKYAVTKIGQ